MYLYLFPPLLKLAISSLRLRVEDLHWWFHTSTKTAAFPSFIPWPSKSLTSPSDTCMAFSWRSVACLLLGHSGRPLVCCCLLFGLFGFGLSVSWSISFHQQQSTPPVRKLASCGPWLLSRLRATLASSASISVTPQANTQVPSDYSRIFPVT